MSAFQKAFLYMMQNEGGYRLHKVKNDPGGMTFAGIARNRHPQWEGWKHIDQDQLDQAQKLVPQFYKTYFWEPVNGDSLAAIDKEIAISLFDFGVNVGWKNAVKELQNIVGAKIDGLLGLETLFLVKAYCNDDKDYQVFCELTIAKIKYYEQLCAKNPKLKKFFLGWVRRALKAEHI